MDLGLCGKVVLVTGASQAKVLDLPRISDQRQPRFQRARAAASGAY